MAHQWGVVQLHQFISRYPHRPHRNYDSPWKSCICWPSYGEIYNHNSPAYDIGTHKFVMATAKGVLLPKIRIGMTGSGLIQISATTNAIHETTLPASNPQTLLSRHSSSSVLFNVNPRSRHPTAKTSVMEPSQSIRTSFWRRVRGRWGSGMSTWIATSREEIARRGNCRRKAERQPIVSLSKPPKGPPRPAPAPKRLALVGTSSGRQVGSMLTCLPSL